MLDLNKKYSSELRTRMPKIIVEHFYEELSEYKEVLEQCTRATDFHQEKINIIVDMGECLRMGLSIVQENYFRKIGKKEHPSKSTEFCIIAGIEKTLLDFIDTIFNELMEG